MSDKKDKKKTEINIGGKERDEIPVEDIKDILTVVNEQLPILIKGLFSSLYDAKSAEQYAQGIATIYKTLTEQGLPPEMIEKLVMNYSESLNVIGTALKNIDVRTDRKNEDD
ncbi:MAG: hypothetical protein FK733_02825 [Asgard group archaeon]|nr:hypothetical protein [Asgard group archaeon]